MADSIPDEPHSWGKATDAASASTSVCTVVKKTEPIDHELLSETPESNVTWIKIKDIT